MDLGWHILQEGEYDDEVAEDVSVTSDGRYVIGCDALYDTSYCGNTGNVDCDLCTNDDPGRWDGQFYGDGACIDCGSTDPNVIGDVDCEYCDGLGYIPCDADGNT